MMAVLVNLMAIRVHQLLPLSVMVGMNMNSLQTFISIRPSKMSVMDMLWC